MKPEGLLQNLGRILGIFSKFIFSFGENVVEGFTPGSRTQSVIQGVNIEASF